MLDRTHYRLGELAYAGGDLPAAMAEYQQVVDRWPHSPLVPRALYGLGWAKLSQNDYTNAERLFDTMIQKYPHDKLRRVPATPGASPAISWKDFGPAIDDVQAMLAADPTPAEKSDAALPVGSVPDGPKETRRGRRKLPSDPQDDPKYAGADKVLYEWAWTLKQQDKQPEAVEVFSRLAANMPTARWRPRGNITGAKRATIGPFPGCGRRVSDGAGEGRPQSQLGRKGRS